MKLGITAIVVCYNEAHFLKPCLESVSFCEEIIVVDLGSSDNSILIAKEFATKVLTHERVPYGEYIHVWLKDKVKFDWLLLIDPDEVLDYRLKSQIFTFFPFEDDIGIVTVPWTFYFKNKRLLGTKWGGIDKFKPLLINRKKAELTTYVHRSRTLKENYVELKIPYEEGENNVVHHFWMHSYRVFLSKHLRYIKEEGRSRYKKGLRTSLVKVIKIPFTSFIDSFFIWKGYKDGLSGFFLSTFWGGYNGLSEFQLWVFQKKVGK